MDVKKRNKEVKQILAKEFGAKNVSVTGGKGTSYGWCYVTIKVRGSFPGAMFTAKAKAEELLKCVAFCRSKGKKDLIIQVEVL